MEFMQKIGSMIGGAAAKQAPHRHSLSLKDILKVDHVKQATGLSGVLSVNDERAALAAIARQNPMHRFDENDQRRATAFLKRVGNQIETREVKLEELADEKAAMDKVVAGLKPLRRLSKNSRYPHIDFEQGFKSMDAFLNSYELTVAKLEHEIAVFKMKQADELKLAPVRLQVTQIRKAARTRDSLITVPDLLDPDLSDDDEFDFTKPNKKQKTSGSQSYSYAPVSPTLFTVCLLVCCCVPVQAAPVQHVSVVTVEFAFQVFFAVFALMVASFVFLFKLPLGAPQRSSLLAPVIFPSSSPVRVASPGLPPSSPVSASLPPDTNCPLCLEPIRDSEDYVRYPCFHHVHTGDGPCGGHRALLASGRTTRCPICRAPFTEHGVRHFRASPSLPIPAAPHVVIPAGSAVLLVKNSPKPYVDLSLDGTKTMEIRSQPCRKKAGERYYLAELGGVGICGSVEFVACHKLNDDTWNQRRSQHCVDGPLFYGQAKSTYAWEFTNPVRFPEPVPYEAKRGAQVCSRTAEDLAVGFDIAPPLSPVSVPVEPTTPDVRHPDFHNRIESSLDVVKCVMPILEVFRRLLGLSVLTVLDPCYCAGEQIENFAGFPNIRLVHMPEMTLGGSFEINATNLARFAALHFDLIFTNPPWSADCLNPVLALLCSLARTKSVPFLYLIPLRCTRTQTYLRTMVGKKLVAWKMPSVSFVSPTSKQILKTRDSAHCSVFGFNYPSGLPDVDEFVVRPPVQSTHS